MQKYKELLLKYKRVIWVSLLGTLIPVLVGFSVVEVRGLIFYYTILFAWILVFAIQEDSVLKILPKLFIGSIFSGIFLFVFVFFRAQIESLIRKGHLQNFSSVSIDIFLPLGMVSAYIFFAGLTGIVIYGFYKLYQKQIEKYFIYFSPIVLGLFSLFIRKNEFGGTIMSRLYGWPFVMLKYNVKDIVDRTVIDQYVFLNSYVYNIILNFLFYFSFLFILTVIFKYIKTKFQLKLKELVFLFFVLVTCSFVLLNFLPWQEFRLKKIVRSYHYCNVTADCKIIEGLYRQGSYIVVNKENYEKVNQLVYSFPSDLTTAWSSRYVTPVCVNNYCTSNSY